MDEQEAKTVHDPIHGTIVLDPLLVKIIDTPQFQRLRNIKQLGSVYFVYPGASHNRFEHSIGTAHLAGQVVRLLKDEQKELEIDEKDVLCVEIAGLCHDLGQGPYSHMFETMFMPRCGKKFQHETASCEMFDYIYEDLKEEFDKRNLSHEDVTFIKEMINPFKIAKVWKYKGRKENKSFLYEIVLNKKSGVDVDTWDYLARDCYHLGIANTFDYNRFLKSLKVMRVKGNGRQICARSNEAVNLYGMFNLRCELQYKAYKHRVASAIDHMICDALVIAEETSAITFTGKNKEKQLTISECVEDPVAFTQLNDGIFQRILHSINPDLKLARGLLNRIIVRKLYTYVCTVHSSEKTKTENKIRKDIAGSSGKSILKDDDLAVTVIKFDFGMEEKNQINVYRFYSKSEKSVVYQISEDVSVPLPRMYEGKSVQIFCKRAGNAANAQKCVSAYCEKHNFTQSIWTGLLSPTRRQFVLEDEESPGPSRRST